MGSYPKTNSYCWATLITKSTYLPGAIILAHSLDQQKSQFPLVVQYTASLGEDSIAALEAEAKRSGRIIPQEVELLIPRTGQENTGSIVAERFKDTFTKLRVFQLYEHGYTKVCFLDADMAVFHNPDVIFDLELPGKDWLGATHACVCNLDSDKWAPSNWLKGNCAFTTIDDPSQTVGDISPDARPTYKLLNGGTLLFHPSEELWKCMLDTFNTTSKLKTYQFPDQDFLADFFLGKWKPISWKFNALKTMRYWHPRMWSDEIVVVVHFIVDKPWERRVSDDGIAGHLGRDGEMHRWWWSVYDDWIGNLGDEGKEVFETMNKLVGKEAPFTEVVPLGQEPGRVEDVHPYP
ncbi:nucleotide-diphospho-sugar transferase [Tothia fuscella]|uniref:Nucleotide-diphospho-sugar transferase n=1 Tax=Tothia fuscella TaxID=1048955 RepID=A0A9P4NRQ8_9PEZI|nr:nucleotide-diphospho-sugar transferase [Tothia fuscella]